MRNNFVFRSQNKDFKFWLLKKIQFQVTKFKLMAFLTQGLLIHDSWSFRNMRLQVLQWENNGIKRMFELKVAMSQSWKKSWLSILRNISSFSSKMTYNVLYPNMAFHLEFTLDQKIWHEIYLLNDILKTWTIQNIKKLRELWIVEVGKNHEMAYNLLYP